MGGHYPVASDDAQEALDKRDLEKFFSELEQTDERDTRKLLKLSGASREDFCSAIPTYPVDEVNTLVDALKMDNEVYGAIGPELDRWPELGDSAKSEALGKAYDILMQC